MWSFSFLKGVNQDPVSSLLQILKDMYDIRLRHGCGFLVFKMGNGWDVQNAA